MAGQTTINGALVANQDIQFGGSLRVNGGAAATGFSIVDPTDATKVLIFDLSGQTTGTTNTFAPAAGGAEVTVDGTQSLTNKGLEDTTTTFFNHTAPTKLVKISAASVTAGQTRTLTVPDSSGTIAYLAGSTFTTATLTAPTINAATLTGAISGGTVAPTVLTVPASTSMTTPAIAGATLTGVITRATQQFFIPAAGLAKVGATAGWTLDAGADTALQTCPASQTAATLVIPIPNLHIGDVITAFSLVGNVTSAGNTATVDANLRDGTAAAAGPTDASIAAMTQLSVVTNTIMSSANTNKGSIAYTVAVNKNPYMLITVTTAASTTVVLQGLLITVTQN